MSSNKCGARRGEYVYFSSCGITLWIGAMALAGLTGCSALPRAEPKAERSVKIRGYQEDAARLRGLTMTQNVAVEQETSSALTASLEKELDKPENRAFLDETELLLRQFRMLKPDVSLPALYLKLMSRQVAAYYDPEKKRLVYVDENVAAGDKKKGAGLQGMERFVYVHELCHALEDGRFGLEGLTEMSMSDLDRNLAVTSFIEGNAVLAGMDGLLDGYGVAVNTATPLNAWLVSLLGDMDLNGSMDGEFEGVPPALAGALLRPYLDGAVFSNRVRRDQGWQGIDAIYESRLPLTTAEILYPERRYLEGFRAAVFEPDPRLFAAARQGVSVNSMGVMGTALWLGGDKLAAAKQFGFLKGWMGDRVYFIKGEGNAVQTVWLSTWERPGMARAFSRRVERRMKAAFGDVSWRVRRDGCLVAAVWTSTGEAACGALAECALKTRVEVASPSWLASWSRDMPWPVRFQDFEGYSAGCEVLGGYAAEVQSGSAFLRMSLASGGLRVESNPDRHYYGVLWGLLRHVEDERSDFTFWKVPAVAAWHRRGQGTGERYRWTVLWGLLADGTEQRARVLFVPVWRKN